jgi:hypothetical protein
LSTINNEPEICLKRLLKRNRKGELSITIDYLQDVIDKTNCFYNNWNGPKICVKTNSTFSLHVPIILNFIEHFIKIFKQADDKYSVIQINI